MRPCPKCNRGKVHPSGYCFICKEKTAVALGHNPFEESNDA